MKAFLSRSDLSGKMEKWYVELGRFHIDYKPITAIKGQVLADFIAKFTDFPTYPTRGAKKLELHQLADQLLQLGDKKA